MNLLNFLKLTFPILVLVPPVMVLVLFSDSLAFPISSGGQIAAVSGVISGTISGSVGVGVVGQVGTAGVAGMAGVAITVAVVIYVA